MTKIKKSIIHRLSRSRSFAALLVVTMAVGFGGYWLPTLFVDAATSIVMNLSATPSNNSTYGVTLRWTGTTPDHWKGEFSSGGRTHSWVSQGTTITLAGLECGVAHTFKVAAAGVANGTASGYASIMAATDCPTVTWDSFAASGNTVSMRWHDQPTFNSAYNLYIKTGAGSYVATRTAATSWTISGSCNTAYTAYITAVDGAYTGPASTTQSATTAPCSAAPVPKPTPTPTPTTPKPKTPAPTPKTTTPTAPTTSAAPATPANFAAEVVSHKIVELTWDKADGVDHYIVNRSSDGGTTWQEVANTNSRTFTDEDTAFSTTYEYQLQAVNGRAEVSPFATAQAVTEAFEASSNRVTTDDESVVITIPEGAIEGEYSCTPNSSQQGAAKLPADKKTLLGPYGINCVTSEGEVIDSFNKPLSVTMKLNKVVDGYGDITAATFQDGSWKTVKSTYNAAKQQLTFNLDDDVAFAAFGVKQSSVWGILLPLLLSLLLVGGALAAYFLWWRRRSGDNYYPVDLPIPPAAPAAAHTPPTLSQAAQTQLAAEQEFKQALAAPDCSHLSMAQQVVPSGTGCYDCELKHTKWKTLRICLVCGHVGCSDDSPRQHALKHFQETGHPLIYEYGNPAGNTIGWCYIDQTYI